MSDPHPQCLKCKTALETEPPQFQLWLPMTEMHLVGMVCLPCMELLVEFLTGQTIAKALHAKKARADRSKPRELYFRDGKISDRYDDDDDDDDDNGPRKF